MDPKRAENLTPMFEPTTCIRGLKLKNRVVFAPSTRWLTPNGIPSNSTTGSMAEYYGKRANIALQVTEGVYMNVKGGIPHQDAAVFYGDALKDWKETVTAVHRHNGLIVPQIHHVGIQTRATPDNPVASPSGISLKGKKVKNCDPMTNSEIQDFRKAYLQAALDAKAIGFDGVAIHAAHGYLMHQFLWETTNRRLDRYGGSDENRRRFLKEVVEDIRTALPEYPIILRFSLFPPRHGDGPYSTVKKLREFLLDMVTAGVDCFDCSTTQFWQVPYPEEHPTRSLAGWTELLSGKPAMAGGCVGMNISNGPTPSYITDVADYTGSFDASCIDRLEDLSNRLKEGEFSLCFVSRAVIADAEFVPKVQQGRFDELTTEYNRETLMKWIEGNHAVNGEEYKFVKPVDKDGKPIRNIEEAKKNGTRIFYPQTVKEEYWSSKI